MEKHPCKYVQLAVFEECKDLQHLESFHRRIVEEGGEGVIFRDPTLEPQPGESTGFLKLKVLLLFSVLLSISLCLTKLFHIPRNYEKGRPK